MGTLEKWNIAGTSPTVQSRITRAGNYAAMHLLNRDSSEVAYRSEVNPSRDPDPQPQKDYWYGWSIFLPEGFTADATNWEILTQFHMRPDKGDTTKHPPLAFSVSPAGWKLTNRWEPNRVSKAERVGSQEFNLGSLRTGVWTDWVVHVRWSYSSGGLLEVWKDGKLVAERSGPNCYNDALMPYFKMGIYNGWKTGFIVNPKVTQRLIYTDEYRMAGPGGSYEDVAPGGGGRGEAVLPVAPTLLEVD